MLIVKHVFSQASPGSFNSDALEAMDFVMETARKLGMKVMLSFADNWKFLGAASSPDGILPESIAPLCFDPSLPTLSLLNINWNAKARTLPAISS